MVELTRLAALPSADPAAAPAARTRARCRAELERRARRQATRVRPVRRRTGSLVWQPVLALLGAAYVAAVIVLALDVLASR